MKLFYKQYILTVLFFSYSSFLRSQKAVVIVPVADLLGTPLSKKSPHSYDNLPLSGGTFQFYDSCPRIHQLLFNEIVEVLEQCNDQVQITTPHIYYYAAGSSNKQATYWTHKRNIINLSSLKKNNINTDLFPEPLSFNQHEPHNIQSLVTLSMPFQDRITNQIYSAGTRFIQTPNQESDTTIAVFIFDPRTQSMKTTTIPRVICVHSDNKTPKEKIRLFVAILKQWIASSTHFIPYGWGCCSFTQHYEMEPFKQTKTSTGSSFYYPHQKKTNPKTGFDCSNMISRAAQIAGIPYFFKNTTTITKCLEPLQEKDRLHEGDIIWIPGHVMVVSDRKNNMLIEASSYTHGQGRVQEVPISQVFSQIKTYKDLKNYHLKKQKVQRINTLTHQVEEPMIPVMLLKMSSVFH